MNPARLQGVSLTLALLVAGQSVGAVAPVMPIHLSGGLPRTVTTKVPENVHYEVLILVASQECPCHWLEAYWAAVKTIKERNLPFSLKVVVSRPKPREFHHLTDLGVRQGDLAEDPDGTLVGQLGLSLNRLPYLLVVSADGDGALVMALQISKNQGDQRSQGAALACIRFLSGELPS